MKIQPLSDLHNEFFRARAPVPPITDSDADVVVLAGDIDTGIAGLKWAAAEADRLGKGVVYVAGNHEFYHHDIALVDRLREFAAAHERIHFLERDAVVIGGVRFLGCTFWTDYRAAGDPILAMLEVRRRLNDHYQIRKRPHLFLPEDALDLHELSRAWLQSQLAQPFDGKTVVVTHHGPSPVCHPPQFAIDALASAFWSDLTDLVERADVWCFGHTHHNIDVQVGKCRLVANQRGYPKEGTRGYRPGLVIELLPRQRNFSAK